ncbi:BamA/TamA family outer membrane protein [Roseovarius aestuarii]|nr:BamA/TamA family outer membrane protein [Roseovarius aestuarii]
MFRLPKRKGHDSCLPIKNGNLFLTATAIFLVMGSSIHSQVVNSVEVRGAEFIPEEDIRLTCGAEAGVEYLDLELRAIEDCLMSTNAFETVDLYRENGETLVIDVQESNTRPGRIEGALSYASQDGILAGVSYQQYNIFDRTYGAARLEFGAETQRYSARLYRTEVFDTSYDFGVEIVGGRDDYDDWGYTHRALRAEGYIVKDLSQTLKFEGGVGYREHRQYDIEPGASALLVKEQTDSISAPYLRFGLRYDSALKAQEGELVWNSFSYGARFDQHFWNIGSADLISDSRLEGYAQFPVAENLRFLVKVSAGLVNGMKSNATRTIDRFFVGADTFRGFAPRGIGPRDGSETLGGNSYIKASLELQQDLGMFLGTQFRGGAFLDTGSVWDLDDTLGGTIDDSFHRRTSIGLSMSFDLGNTPVSVYLAKPIESQPGDENQVFGLSLSTHF